MTSNPKTEREPAVNGRGGWFADVYLEELAGERGVHAEVKLRTPDGMMLRAVGRSLRDPHDRDGLRHPRLAIARALCGLARLLVAHSDADVTLEDARTRPWRGHCLEGGHTSRATVRS
jgi:hypothetical protein